MRVNRGEIIGLGGLEGQGSLNFCDQSMERYPWRAGQSQLLAEKSIIKVQADAVKDGIGFISGNRNRESIFNLRHNRENIYSVQKCRWGEIFPLYRIE
jgi:ABC-type sugar transport system ATPase subunit